MIYLLSPADVILSIRLNSKTHNQLIFLDVIKYNSPYKSRKETLEISMCTVVL